MRHMQQVFADGPYVMDRAYIDFGRLHRLHRPDAFFATRAKFNTKAHRIYSAASGVIADQTIALDGLTTRQDYPDHLRRIRFRDLGWIAISVCVLAAIARRRLNLDVSLSTRSCRSFGYPFAVPQPGRLSAARSNRQCPGRGAPWLFLLWNKGTADDAPADAPP
jgi:hypothetical protein